jgi:hypothetical protein
MGGGRWKSVCCYVAAWLGIAWRCLALLRVSSTRVWWEGGASKVKMEGWLGEGMMPHPHDLYGGVEHFVEYWWGVVKAVYPIAIGGVETTELLDERGGSKRVAGVGLKART